RLFADLSRFVADFTARSAGGVEIGRGVFAAGRVRRLQPFQRVASFAVPAGDSAVCRAVASVELDIQSCVLDGTGDVGVAYCENAFRSEGGDIRLELAGQVPDGPAEELLVEGLGITFSNLTRALATAHGIRGTVKGLVVVAIPQPAVARGLREGDLVVEVEQERVPTLADLVRQVSAARDRGQKSVLCMIVRNGERHWLVARFLAETPSPEGESSG
ncbi:MAG: PDZ domain-containing protein, partial [Rhodospirillales bacterium]|nr:PDZ domain-containing protein [Rhodospirillales bacterium]